MTLTAHNRPVFILQVASFAISMESLHKARPSAGRFRFVALRTSLVFGRFIFDQLAVIIVDMMTLIAFLNFSGFIVIIVSENSRRPPLNPTSPPPRVGLT